MMVGKDNNSKLQLELPEKFIEALSNKMVNYQQGSNNNMTINTYFVLECKNQDEGVIEKVSLDLNDMKNSIEMNKAIHSQQGSNNKMTINHSPIECSGNQSDEGSDSQFDEGSDNQSFVSDEDIEDEPVPEYFADFRDNTKMEIKDVREDMEQNKMVERKKWEIVQQQMENMQQIIKTTQKEMEEQKVSTLTLRIRGPYPKKEFELDVKENETIGDLEDKLISLIQDGENNNGTVYIYSISRGTAKFRPWYNFTKHKTLKHYHWQSGDSVQYDYK